MRIAMLCTDLGIRVPNETKGASIHLLSVARAFKRAGHDVLLVGVAGHGAPPDHIETFLLPHPGRSEGLERERRKLAFVEHVVRAAAPCLEGFGPDVLYERLALFGTAGRRLSELLDVPHALEVNALLAKEESTWRGLQLRGLAERLEHHVLEGADVCVAVSSELRSQILEAAPNARVRVVENGAESEYFRVLPERTAARRRLGLPREARLVVFVGALRPWHGVDVALAALARLPEEIHLVVAGDGPARPSLEALATARRVTDRIHWLGHVPHTEIPVVLAAGDVAVAPYPRLEQFAFSPLKLFEYQAAGIPIVASDVGQVRIVLREGDHGRLVPPGNESALAEGILEALRPEARLRASRARRYALQAHSWDARIETIAAELTASIASRRVHALAT